MFNIKSCVDIDFFAFSTITDVITEYDIFILYLQNQNIFLLLLGATY